MSRKDACSSLGSKSYTTRSLIQSIISTLSSVSRSDLFVNPYTFYLFTKSDIKTVVLPTIAFAAANVLSGRCVTLVSQPGSQNSLDLEPHGVSILRLGLATAWTWMGLLLENVANQRLPQSVVEDSINKPWRPIVCSRVSSDQARKMLIALIGLFYAFSLLLGVQGPCLSLVVFTYIYNDLQGADEHIVLRNIFNACGLMSFGAGATIILGSSTTIAMDSGLLGGEIAQLTGLGWTWMLIIGLVITTTVSAQDLEDVEGDEKRGRRTLPLIWGQRATRTYLAISILVWNAICVAFWQTTIVSSVIPVAVSISLALNLTLGDSLQADKRSWQLWCLWVITLYCLPALSAS